MKTLVVYGGRFQPPHKGHKASYDRLVAKFGQGSVFMASADKATGPKDPFNWMEKKRIAISMGIPSDKFIKVMNSYSAKSIRDAVPYNPDDTVVVVAVSQKDGDRLVGSDKDSEGYALKKDGQRASIQWLGKDPKPVSQGHIYAVVTPTVEFSVAGQHITGATQIRDMYATATTQQRNQILHDMYGNVPTELFSLFNKRLGVVQTESLLREFIEFIAKF